MEFHHRSYRSEQECLKVQYLIWITVDKLHINKLIEDWNKNFAY